jgi:phospholipase C
MASEMNKVKHFVVLMLENRSFDNMLGYLYAAQGVGEAWRGHRGPTILRSDQ